MLHELSLDHSTLKCIKFYLVFKSFFNFILENNDVNNTMKEFLRSLRFEKNQVDRTQVKVQCSFTFIITGLFKFSISFLFGKDLAQSNI